jgi:hypothetical protein
MSLPILDPKPTGRAQDWKYDKIRAMKAPVAFPTEYKNPFVNETAPRDQFSRGTCVGQSTAYCYDLLYMMLTGDKPTPTDKAEFATNIIDQVGTIHDRLYPQSASAECFYQKSREIGQPVYGTGSEIRWVVRAWKDYGMNLETQWHLNPGWRGFLAYKLQKDQGERA